MLNAKIVKINNHNQLSELKLSASDLLRSESNTRFAELHEQQYAPIINGYKTLFDAARFPSTSRNGCERQLTIYTQRDTANAPTNEAIVRAYDSSNRISSFHDAYGFKIMWSERSNKDECWHQTWVDNFAFSMQSTEQYKPGRWEQNRVNELQSWIDAALPRSIEVYDILMTALQDESLNPRHAHNAQAYVANLQRGILLQA